MMKVRMMMSTTTSRRRITFRFTTLLMIFTLTVLQLPGSVVQGQESSQCAVVFERAMQSLEQSCADVKRNQACYGNHSVKAVLRDTNLTFDQVGARVEVPEIERLSAAPLNLERELWGLTLLKLKVNLPDTMPGENVTFIIQGDTSVDNISGDMQVFYFTSGLGMPQCKQMPPSSIVIHSPKHARISFRANGVDISIGSTVVMSAQPNSQMDFYLVEGSATLTSKGQTVELAPQQTTSIPLGGLSGLEAVGAPSAPANLTAEAPITEFVKHVNKLFGDDDGKGKNNNNGIGKGGNGKNDDVSEKDKGKDKGKSGKDDKGKAGKDDKGGKSKSDASANASGNDNNKGKGKGK